MILPFTLIDANFWYFLVLFQELITWYYLISYTRIFYTLAIIREFIVMLHGGFLLLVFFLFSSSLDHEPGLVLGADWCGLLL